MKKNMPAVMLPQPGWKNSSSQTAGTAPSIITEYQDTFRRPGLYTAIQTTTKSTNPYHSLRGTSEDVFKLSVMVKHKKVPKPPKIKHQSSPTKDYRRCKVVQFVPHHETPAMEFKSTYNSDFRVFPPCRANPWKPKQNLHIKHGVLPQEQNCLTGYKGTCLPCIVQVEAPTNQCLQTSQLADERNRRKNVNLKPRPALTSDTNISVSHQKDS